MCQKNLILQSLGSLFLSPIDGLLHVTIPKGKGEEERKKKPVYHRWSLTDSIYLEEKGDDNVFFFVGSKGDDNV